MTASVADKIKAVETYVDSYCAGDLDGIVSIFAEDATVEDPVGTPLHAGKNAIRAFFSAGVEMGAQLKLLGSIRCSNDFAAFPFAVELDFGGSQKRIEVIDTFKFNEHGKVIEMRAFWGPENMQDN